MSQRYIGGVQALLHSFLTSQHYIDVSDQPCAPAPLPTGKELLAPSEQETGWIHNQPICFREEKELMPLQRIKPKIVQQV